MPKKYNGFFWLAKIFGCEPNRSAKKIPSASLVTLYMHSSIETAPLCKIVEQSDHYSWRYCILKIWGIQVSSANAVWVLI